MAIDYVRGVFSRHTLSPNRVKAEDICGKFNPDLHNISELFGVYQNFRLELDDLDTRMVSYNFTAAHK